MSGGRVPHLSGLPNRRIMERHKETGLLELKIARIADDKRGSRCDWRAFAGPVSPSVLTAVTSARMMSGWFAELLWRIAESRQRRIGSLTSDFSSLPIFHRHNSSLRSR